MISCLQYRVKKEIGKTEQKQNGLCAIVGRDWQQYAVQLLVCHAHFQPASPPCRATPLVAGVLCFTHGAPLNTASAPKFTLSGVSCEWTFLSRTALRSHDLRANLTDLRVQFYTTRSTDFMMRPVSLCV
jgi:hypothetical protein